MEQRPPLGVRLLPRRLVSRALGFLARRRLPGFLLRPLLRVYVRRAGVDLEEAARPLKDYRSFTDFFTRALRDGARPLPGDPAAVACPCDGRVSSAGRVHEGTLLQVKGHAYPLAELLDDAQAARALEGGSYVVLYLAPGDYHRFHWPFDGRLDDLRHVPGDLWPVNPRSVAGVERLFVRNERVVCLGRTAAGGRFAYVPVGALNVGSIRLAFHDVRTNRARARAPRSWPLAVEGRRGEAFGRFELGSTLVLVLAADAGRLEPPPAGTRVRLGEPLGTIGGG
jgi:phosphatidylserine decarboxylase